MKRICLVALFFALAAANVFANGQSESTPQPAASTSAEANAGSASLSDADATGGSAAAGAVSSSEGSDASNTTNVSNSTKVERSVPTMVAGSAFAVGCGSGVQGGGASTHGAGFLGATWTTDRCYALVTGSAFAAAGDYELACELWVAANAKMFRKRRITDIDCKERARLLHAAQNAANTAPPAAAYVTEEQLREHEKRITRHLLAK